MTHAGDPLPLTVWTVVGAALRDDDAFDRLAARPTRLPRAAKDLVLLLKPALFTARS